VKAAWTRVVIVAVVALTACGGGGKSFPAKPTVQGPIVQGPKGVWIFRPAGEPKRLVIFFHGQGGPSEATPAHHVRWIRHLVTHGSAVVYPRYELSYSREVLEPAIAGVRTAAHRLNLPNVPVVALGYSRGGALAVEYAAAAPKAGVPVPVAVESVNTVPWGEWSRLTDLTGLRHDTVLELLISDQDTGGVQGARGLLRRLEKAGFPGTQIKLAFAKSHGSFVADHLAPLRDSRAARKAYWAPTDALLKQVG
jgi:pimeloyl-ACP methyl ester carboxylesterase